MPLTIIRLAAGRRDTARPIWTGPQPIGLGGNSVVLIATQDAVQEFSVATNNVSPEYGRFNGGVVNMATKSGTNAFHGSAYEYFRNTVLNANDFFANQAGTDRAAFNQNQYGVTLGGPIRKDKTFFFSWEQFRAKIGQTYTATVPTAAEKAGDFSKSGVNIYDPLTSAYASDGSTVTRSQFANNIIPANRIDYTANAILNVLKYYPNTNGTGYNYINNFNPGGNQQQFNVRVDQNSSDKQRFFSRFTYWTVDDIAANRYGNLTGGAGSRQHTHQAVLGHTYSFSPTLIMDSRLSFTRAYYDDQPQSLGFDLSQYGSAWATLASQVTYQELIGVSISNYGAFTGLNVTSRHFRDTWALSSNLAKMAGYHTIKFGGEIRLMDYNYAQSTNPSGTFTFNTAFTSANGLSTGTTGNSLASLLLGYSSSGTLTTVSPISQYGWYQGYYLGDTFQVNSKLTLNYGVRWELPGGMAEKYDRATVLLTDKTDPLSTSTGLNLKGQLAFVNSSDYLNRTTMNTGYKHFSPRVGFAYRFASDAVLRGGYGISLLPTDANTGVAPSNSTINSAATSMVTARSSGINSYIPANTLSNPFPRGVLQPSGRNYNLSSLEGLSISGPISDEPLGYAQQWNMNLQKEFMPGLLVEVRYAGARAIHLPTGISMNLNQLDPSYFYLKSALNTKVANPFAGLVSSSGSLNGSTISRGQLLRPYPQFSTVSDSSARLGTTVYNSMQLRVEKRFGSAGIINGNYT